MGRTEWRILALTGALALAGCSGVGVRADAADCVRAADARARQFDVAARLAAAAGKPLALQVAKNERAAATTARRVEAQCGCAGPPAG